MKPLVTIGIPVKNGFAKRYPGAGIVYTDKDINLSSCLDTIINQSYTNLEIIVSNNGSTDETASFLDDISKKDKRIKVFHQTNELLLFENFRFVLEKSTGKYFKWNAADDMISNDYIEHNVNFLEKNLDYICSSSKFWFEDNDQNVYFNDLDNNLHDRIKKFFKIRFISHNIFFGLSRKNVLLNILNTNKLHDYLGVDWMIDLYLLFEGKYKTIKEGHIIIGTKGVSKSVNYLKIKRFNKKIIYKILPFYELTKDLVKKIILIKKLTFFEKISIFLICIKINLSFIKKHKMNQSITRTK